MPNQPKLPVSPSLKRKLANRYGPANVKYLEAEAILISPFTSAPDDVIAIYPTRGSWIENCYSTELLAESTEVFNSTPIETEEAVLQACNRIIKAYKDLAKKRYAEQIGYSKQVGLSDAAARECEIDIWGAEWIDEMIDTPSPVVEPLPVAWVE